MLNGNELLQKHISEGQSIAQYTSGFNVEVLLIETIDWNEGKLMYRLQESPYFSILGMTARTSVLKKSYPSVVDG